MGLMSLFARKEFKRCVEDCSGTSCIPSPFECSELISGGTYKLLRLSVNGVSSSILPAPRRSAAYDTYK